MSFSLAAIGFVGTIITILVPEFYKSYIFIPFAFYTCMEFLQGIQYFSVNECGSLHNVIGTEIAYILVIVQPLMWNLLFYFRTSPRDCSKNLFLVGIAMSIVWIIFSVASRIVITPQNTILHNPHSYMPNKEETGLSKEAINASGCTMQASPKNHLYWKWKSAYLFGLDANWLMYLMIWFIPALLSESEIITIGGILFGAVIAAIVTINYGAKIVEFASLWCLFSVPLLFLMFIDVIMNFIKNHYL